MNLKNIIISASVLTVGILSINAIRKGEPKDTLDKRKFTVTMTEIKEGAQSMRWVDIDAISENDFTFIIDKHVADLLEK